jgi:dUTP pyrophosphatase
MRLNVVKLSEGATLPTYAHPGDAGLDLCAAESCELPPGEWRKIRTGIAIELPRGTEGQVRPRSGLALHHGVALLNSPGTIDEGYRGEVGVILINHGSRPFRVAPGMRIAQLVVQPVVRVEVCEVESLGETPRGSDGFGSTGGMGQASGQDDNACCASRP